MSLCTHALFRTEGAIAPSGTHLSDSAAAAESQGCARGSLPLALLALPLVLLVVGCIMAELLYQPEDFAIARAALQGKLILPTTLNSAQIAATWNAETKNRAFFSALQAREDLLRELQTEAQALMNILSPVDGVVIGNDLASARLRFQTFLERNGWQLPEGVEPGSIQDISSARRINLVLNMQVQEAYATGAYRQQHEPQQVEMYPYLRYVADPRPTRRADHWRLNGLILPKRHPFWRGHTPPWDYNCFCSVDEMTESEAQKAGVAQAVVRDNRVMVSFRGQAFDVLAPESGFTFDPGAA